HAGDLRSRGTPVRRHRRRRGQVEGTAGRPLRRVRPSTPGGEMSKKTGFTAMADQRATGAAPHIGVGMLGYAFMGKAHSNAYKTLPYMMYPPVAIPDLVAICGRDLKAVQEAQKRYGYAKHYTDWRKMLEDPEVQLLDNGGPN